MERVAGGCQLSLAPLRRLANEAGGGSGAELLGLGSGRWASLLLLCTCLPFGFPPVAGSVARPSAALRETLECTLEQLVAIRG